MRCSPLSKVTLTMSFQPQCPIDPQTLKVFDTNLPQAQKCVRYRDLCHYETSAQKATKSETSSYASFSVTSQCCYFHAVYPDLHTHSHTQAHSVASQSQQSTGSHPCLAIMRPPTRRSRVVLLSNSWVTFRGAWRVLIRHTRDIIYYAPY